jgi:hypothetical protein
MLSKRQIFQPSEFNKDSQRLSLCITKAIQSCACVSAIKPYEGFGDVDHTIKELMSL